LPLTLRLLVFEEIPFDNFFPDYLAGFGKRKERGGGREIRRGKGEKSKKGRGDKRWIGMEER